MSDLGGKRSTHYYGDDCPGGHLDDIDLSDGEPTEPRPRNAYRGGDMVDLINKVGDAGKTRHWISTASHTDSDGFTTGLRRAVPEEEGWTDDDPDATLDDYDLKGT